MSQHKLAVLGNPITHSRSPDIHKMFAAQSGIALRYERIQVPDGEFRQFAGRLIEEGYTGFNVTLPCKGDAFGFAKICSASAIQSEAVNTISLANGNIRGDNTDGSGLVRDITRNLGWDISDKRILILGAGGAVRGVLPALLQAEPAAIHLLNRTLTTAEDIVARMADERMQAVTDKDLEDDYDLVINGTSAGITGDLVALPKTVLCADTRVYDMIYGAGLTHFNRWCVEVGACKVSDGLGMLVEQAALSFRCWFAVRVKTSDVITRLRNLL